MLKEENQWFITFEKTSKISKNILFVLKHIHEKSLPTTQLTLNSVAWQYFFLFLDTHVKNQNSFEILPFYLVYNY